MAKKRKKYYYYKKKTKKVRYVSNALKKYFTKRYKDYSKRQQRAREIYNDILASGEKVILANIFKRERKSRNKIDSKNKDLFLPNDLLDPTYFFNVESYPFLIKQSGKDITFESTFFNKDLPEIKGGEEPSYAQYFSPLVGYCNKMLSESVMGEVSSDDIMWYVKCLPPVKKGNKYIVEIVACNAEGEVDEENFGFDPQDDSDYRGFTQKDGSKKNESKKSISAKENKLNKKEKELALKEKELIERELNIKKEIEEAKRKSNLAETIKAINEQLKAGVITKSQAKELYKKLI